MLNNKATAAANAHAVTVDFGGSMAPTADAYAPCIVQPYLYARSIAYTLNDPSRSLCHAPDAVLRDTAKGFACFNAALHTATADLQRDDVKLTLDLGGKPSVVCSLSQEQRTVLKRALCEDLADITTTVMTKATAPKLFDGQPLPRDPAQCERELSSRLVDVRAQLKTLNARAARLREAHKTMQRLVNNRKVAEQAASGDDVRLFTGAPSASAAAVAVKEEAHAAAAQPDVDVEVEEAGASNKRVKINV
jgi:hypothetical protein